MALQDRERGARDTAGEPGHRLHWVVRQQPARGRSQDGYLALEVPHRRRYLRDAGHLERYGHFWVSRFQCLFSSNGHRNGKLALPYLEPRPLFPENLWRSTLYWLRRYEYSRH